MKKIMISLLLVFLLTGITACGNKTAERDVEATFENSVFMGDSITEGFVFNEILPRGSVIAGAGMTAGFIYDDVGELVEKRPDNVFIMLGSIDILMPVDNPKELFRSDLMKLISKIKEELPDSRIFLQSITPVTQEALKKEPRYERIAEYNVVVKEVADKLSVNYVDLRRLVEEYQDLYAEDGIHFKKGFYQFWLEKLPELM